MTLVVYFNSIGIAMITQFKNNIALLHGDNSKKLSWPRGAGFFIGDNMEIPYGYCHCGCGQKTSIAKQSNTKRGHIKNLAIKFIKGHHNYLKNYKGKNHPQWKGGITYDGVGRKYIYDLSCNNSNHYKYEYIFICEKILGRKLKKSEVIHHVDSNFKNNANTNLVICQDTSYHGLLHQRTRAYKASGHADWRKCWICKQYDDPKNMYISNNKKTCYHNKCLYNYRHKNKISELQGE